MIKRFSYIVIFSILITTLILGYFASKLKFDYNLDHFFPKDDTENTFFKEYKNNFGNDEDFLLIGIDCENGIFNSKTLNKLNQLTLDLESTNLILKVTSPTNITNPIISPFGIMNNAHIHVNDSTLWEEDSIEIYKTNYLINNLFSADRKKVNVYIKTEKNIFKPKSDSLLKSINQLLSKHQFKKTHIAGKIKAQSVYIDKMQKEFVMFTGLAVCILIVLLFFAFRTWWGIAIPMIVVLCSIINTLGIYSIMGQHLDVMTVILPTIMFVVGLSDVIHFTAKYLEELRSGKTNEAAIITTIKEVGFATFLTAFTTALGFATLATANVLPIQNFGIYTALGVLIAYCLSFTLLPSILIHLKKPKIAEKKQIFWDIFLHNFLLKIFKHKYKIIIGFCVILAISIGFTTRIKTNTKVLDDIAENDPLMKDFRYFENHFGGIRSFELEINFNQDSLKNIDLTLLKQLESTENYLKETYHVSNMISPVSIVKIINKAMNGGQMSFYKLPNTEDEFKKIKNIIYKYRKKNEFKSYLNFEKNIARISGKTKDEGSFIMNNKNKELLTFLKKQKNNHLSFHITGSAHLINLNNDYITNDMMSGLILDLIVVAVIILLLFKSFKMSVIAVIPNLIPLILVGAIMGLTGIELKISTSIVFSIAFGIAVDDTIHFIAKLKHELNKGSSVFYAVKRTYISTGKAIIITTIILIGGFITLLLSTFQGTFYLGLLVSLTLVIAVLTDLLLLPILVVLFYKKN
jgi:predicted RND superfamily exporter protein